jgi:hypothetical protein
MLGAGILARLRGALADRADINPRAVPTTPIDQIPPDQGDVDSIEHDKAERAKLERATHDE